MYVLVVAISGGDVVATSVVAKSAPSAGRQSQETQVSTRLLLHSRNMLNENFIQDLSSFVR